MSETTTDTLAEIEGQVEQPVQVREGWWAMRGGRHIRVQPMSGEDFGSIAYGYTWRCIECKELQWNDKGVHLIDSGAKSRWDLVRYLGPIDSKPEPEQTIDEQIAEIEGQAEPQPVQVREGRWRTRNGEIRNVTPTPEARKKLFNQSRYSWYDAQHNQTWLPSGHYTLGGESQWDLVKYLGPIQPEPEQTITPDDVAAEALAGVNDWPSVQTLRRQLETTEAALLEQQQRNEQLVTQGSRQHIEIAELQAQVAFLKGRELTLGTRLEEEKTVTTKRLQQVEELRSEVSHVQGLLGEEKRRFAELEALASDLRAVNAATEKAINAAARDKADLQHRLDTVAAEWAVQAETIRELQTQLEAVKAELVQERLERNQWQNHAQRTETQLFEKISECRNLRIELDALQQAPRAETVAAAEAVSDRFDQGFEHGKARAVEMIAEWTEPFRTCGSQALAYHVLQNLPHIMRSLTGLTEED